MRIVAVIAGTVAIATAALLTGPEWSPSVTAQSRRPDFVRASATLNSCTDGSVVGSATFVEPSSSESIKNVTVQLLVQSLTPGQHAVQIHEVGACEPCSAAGSHLDLGPFGNNLPVTANHPYHSGDLVNVNVGSRGTGFMSHVTSRIALSTGGLSIFDLDGAALVVHALPDTYCSDPSDPNCAGGGRVACGVIVPAQ